jgi:hypothetical protein
VLEREIDSRDDVYDQIKRQEVAADKGLTENSEDGSLLEQFTTKKKLEEKKENETYTYTEICRMTKGYFSIDWINEEMKYPKETVNGIEMKSIRDLFSSNVYWHYINNQYFPIDLFSSKFDSFLDAINERLMNSIALTKEPNHLNDDLVKFVFDNASNKQLNVDQLIDLSVTEMEVTVRKIKVIKEEITKRIKYLLHSNEFDGNSVLLSTGNVFTAQTIKGLLLDEHEILKDSIYHNQIDIEYLERREKTLKKQNTFSLPKKRIHHVEGRATRNCAGFEIPEMEAPVQSRFLLYNHMNCQVCVGEYEDPSNKLLCCSVCLTTKYSSVL